MSHDHDEALKAVRACQQRVQAVTQRLGRLMGRADTDVPAALAPAVLVVEDSDDDWMFTQRTLPEGWDLERATTLRAAKTALAKRRYDLMLLDLDLPDSTPEATARWGAGTTVPTVIVSNLPAELVPRPPVNGRPPLGVFTKGHWNGPRLLDAIVAEARSAQTYFHRSALRRFERLLAQGQLLPAP